MKILYCHDNVYYKDDQEKNFSAGQFGYDYWQPYLEAFGSLTVLGRGEHLPDNADMRKMSRSDGQNVEVKTFKNINSPRGLWAHKAQVTSAILKEVGNSDGVIIRAMSEIGWIAFKEARRLGLPIAHELSGCPWDNTWNHGSLIGKLYAPVRYLRARKVAREADGVIYVTRDFLPTRYPAKGLTAIASNVRLEKPKPAVLERRKEKVERSSAYLSIGLIGQLDHKLKGIDVAIKALAAFKEKHPSSNVNLHLLGPGNPKKYETLIKDLNLTNNISFDGILSGGQAVYNWLDNIDIYIQPSFHEGLPRALIEAMSRGCPCLASTAGGIRELLDEDFLHKPGDYDKLAKDIEKIHTSTPSELKQISETNFKKSLHYTSEKLIPIRQEFWGKFANTVKQHHG
ncbi:MAG: glycosyl transferase family 1 [Alphaproteobacteria bacterium]|nr:glycosyl transferase family 1 [Alphaproteobacteria bacterium]